MERNRILEYFTYYAPKDNQLKQYELIRDMGLALADMVNDLGPDSREKSLSITKLQEAVMWANALIAINEKGEKK